LVLAGICPLWLAIQAGWTCSVPVFRYALERWKPDPYKGIFIHQGGVTKRDQALLEQLEEAALNPECPLNLRIRAVDKTSFSEKKLEELLKGPVPENLPALAIWYPDQMGKKPPLWTVELTPAVVKALTDSTKRRYLAERLINGESIVWVFVPSGNPEKDNRAKALIQREIDSSLVELSKLPFYVLAGSKEKRLPYRLSILTLSRSDPGERFLLDMLLKSESDLVEHKDEPMVFPIFGRGRLLGCLFGEYITPDKIQGAISFLAASCSCQVKALNPGMDLLIAAPWDRVVLDSYVEDTPLPELTGVMPDTPASQKPPARDAERGRGSKSIFANYGITLGSALVVVLFASLVLSHRRKKD
jgi:hypothetical protein